MHLRNRHREYLDYRDLASRQPSLLPFVYTNRFGGTSIDYANDLALRELTRCLLFEFYSLSFWKIPDGYLCPPVPQRVDYIHRMADLISRSPGSVPHGQGVRGLDVGTGASCIYCVLGVNEYGWSFIGSDTDPVALASAKKIIKKNHLAQVDLRHQPDASRIFSGVLHENESVAFCLSNPPFHESSEHAARAAGRKWQRLGRSEASVEKNYQGRDTELCCAGGEVGFVTRMVEESLEEPVRSSCVWFSAMLSRETSLKSLLKLLDSCGAQRRVFEMRQGKMLKWVLAWTFLTYQQRDVRAASWERDNGSASSIVAGKGNRTSDADLTSSAWTGDLISETAEAGASQMEDAVEKPAKRKRHLAVPVEDVVEDAVKKKRKEKTHKGLR